MSSSTPAKIPSIKIKLSLSNNHLPSTPTPASQPALSLKKGKEKVTEELRSTPIIKLHPASKASKGDDVTIVKSKGSGVSIPSSSLNMKIKMPSGAATSLPVDEEKSVSNGGPQSSSSFDRPTESSSRVNHAITPTSKPRPTPVAARQTKVTTISTPKPTHKSQATSKPPKTKPTAIPARLLSASLPSTPATPNNTLPETPLPFTPPPPSIPVTPSPIPSAPETPLAEVKLELDVATPATADTPADTASRPLTPGPQEGEGTPVDTPNQDVDDRGMRTAKWMRLRRPFKELAQKVLTELKKRDDYGLFLEPVNPDDYPDYLKLVGGEDKMMDFETMQHKLDSRQYRNMDQVESDLRILATAAQNFNPAGTIPHNAAIKILNYGLKFIDRYRPLVRTPSPSPERHPASASATPWRGRSRTTGRENTVLTDEDAAAAAETRAKYQRAPKPEVPPHMQIPEQMLRFRPNSAEALAVGWSLTGGRRLRLKKFIRGREKFSGKWRDWDFDGSRDVAEIDDIDTWFEKMRYRSGEEWKNIVDWKGLRNGEEWWDWDGVGGANNQPPLPGSNIPLPKTDLKRRDLGWSEWGVYPEVEAELTLLSRRSNAAVDHLEIFSEQLRPSKPRQRPNAPSGVYNIFDDRPGGKKWGDWIREMGTGGLQGEAYIRSVEKFVKGAMDGASWRKGDGEDVVKAEEGIKSDEIDITLPDYDQRMELNEYVWNEYHGGVLASNTTRTINDTLYHLQNLVSPHSQATKSEPDHSITTGSSNPLASLSKSDLLNYAKPAYARQALRIATLPTNAFDIRPLLKTDQDFMHVGHAAKTNITSGLEYAQTEIQKLIELGQQRRKRPREEVELDTSAKRLRQTTSPTQEPLSTASSPLSQPPDSPTKSGAGQPEVIDTEEGHLKNLRLELVALSKFYPLAALKKMTKEEAAKYLPENIRGLMSR